MIRIDVDFEQPLRMLVNLEDGLRDKVIARTLNRIGDQAKIQARREMEATRTRWRCTWTPPSFRASRACRRLSPVWAAMS